MTLPSAEDLPPARAVRSWLPKTRGVTSGVSCGEMFNPPSPPYNPVRQPRHLRRLMLGAFLIFGVSLVACADRKAKEQTPPPKPAAKPLFDRSLLRADRFPSTSDDNGPWTLEQRRAFYGVPGVAVVAWNEGAIVVDEAFGLANLEQQVAMTTDTIVRLGPRLTVGTASLVAASQLTANSRNLNESLRDQLARLGLAPTLRDVTLGQLLNHSAGIGPKEIPTDVPTTDQLLRSRAEPLFPAGSAGSFSETGYVVAQRIFEQITALPWSELAASRLTKPLGLNQTSFSDPPPGSAFAGRYDARGRVTPTPRIVAPAVQGLFSSATDISLLLRAVEDTLLDDRREPWSPRQLRFAVEPGLGDWGMGWQVMRNDQGQSTHMMIARDKESVVIASLRRKAGAVIVTNSARGALLADEILLGLAQQLGWTELQPHMHSQLPPDQKTLTDLVGTYQFGSGEIEVQWNEAELLLVADGKVEGLGTKPHRLLPLERELWMLADAPYRIRLQRTNPIRLIIDDALAVKVGAPESAPITIEH